MTDQRLSASIRNHWGVAAFVSEMSQYLFGGTPEIEDQDQHQMRKTRDFFDINQNNWRISFQH